MSFKNIVYPIVLSGGSGTRLWPLSRPTMPKQFVKLLDEVTLFENTISRLNGDFFSTPIIVSGDISRFMVKRELEKLKVKAKHILIEPEPKDTAAAALSGIMHAECIAKDPIVLICPSDHWIEDVSYFKNIINKSTVFVKNDNIITFGVKPLSPHTGYGWIEINSKYKKIDQNTSAYKVDKFIEKPTLEKTKILLESEYNFWNSGIFLGRCSTFIKAYKKFATNTFEIVHSAYKNSKMDLDFLRLEKSNWKDLKKISIDYAIIEKYENILMIPFSEKWSDVGSMHSLMQHYTKDENQNVAIGNSTIIDSENTFLNCADSDIHLVGMGLKNIIAVATKDAVLCVDQNKSESVRIVVEKLIENKIEQAEKSLTDFRPWGSFEILSRGKNFQVKKIKVLANCKLSLQSHKYRSEHWVVVDGSAIVTLGDEKMTISKNESIFINSGVKHRLENPNDQTLTIIEIQTGTYLGEDDIIRYEDDYKRIGNA